MNLKDANLWRQHALIGGKWVSAADNRTIDVNDPAS